MIKVLTKDIYGPGLKDGHRGGPKLFMEKLINSCSEQGLAEFTFNPFDSYDAVLEGTIGLRDTFSLNEVVDFRSRGKPFVLRLNGLGGKRFKREYVKSNCKVIQHASHVIYQSQYCQAAWLGSCPNSVHQNSTIIMNGDDPERFLVEPMFPAYPGTTFAAAASWGPVKRLDFIVDLFKSLIENGADVSLVLAGRLKEGVTLPHIEDKFKHRIAFCGYVAPSEIPAFYRSADAFIHARAGDWCPNAVVEAVCAGLPGIVHSVGGTSEIVGEAGVAIDDYDIGEASRSVLELIDNYDFYKRKAAERLKLLDIRFVARRYIGIIKQDLEQFDYSVST